MAVSTFSQFFYGFDIDSTNQNMNINEGSGELLAQVSINSYAISDLILAVKTALDAISGVPQVYTVSFDRGTRRVTISSTGTFDLLTNSGTQVGTSIWSLLGFDTSTDKTGQSSYTSENGAGSVYVTQFPIQDYIGSGFKKQSVQQTVNEAASGNLEVVKFGNRQIIEMTMFYITNKGLGCYPFLFNANGVQDALDFLDFATTKAPMEFMENKDLPSNFSKVVLESTTEATDGTGYFLQEETGKNLPDVYTTGLLTFRVES